MPERVDFRSINSGSPDLCTLSDIKFDYSKNEKEVMEMKIWTVQPLFVYEQLKEGMVFH